MDIITALAVSISILGGIAAFAFLSPFGMGLQIWAAFVGWATFYHCGGKEAGLGKAITHNVFGAVMALVLLLLVTQIPLGATLGGFAILVASTTLDALDAAGSAQPYLPTHYWLKFVDLFRNPVLWRDVERGLLLQAVYVAVMLGAAWAYFTSKDIKS